MLASASAGFQAFEIIGVAVVLLISVLAVYGALIRLNYDRVTKLYGRLFGNDDDETQAGFIQDSERRYGELEEKVENHAAETHQQLYLVDRKIDILLERSDIDTDRDGLPRVPPPESRDFMRGGGPRTDDAGDNLPPNRTGDDD